MGERPFLSLLACLLIANLVCGKSVLTTVVAEADVWPTYVYTGMLSRIWDVV
jgi:hypothetical protein